MGLSTAYGNAVMFVIFLSLLATLMGVYTTYMGETPLTAVSQADAAAEVVGTDISISSIATTTTDDSVRIYVVNDGRVPLEMNCTDFYLDRAWIRRSQMDQLVLLNTSFSPGVWDPSETILMRTNFTADHGLPHEGRVVACNGVSDSMIFRWTT